MSKKVYEVDLEEGKPYTIYKELKHTDVGVFSVTTITQEVDKDVGSDFDLSYVHDTSKKENEIYIREPRKKSDLRFTNFGMEIYEQDRNTNLKLTDELKEAVREVVREELERNDKNNRIDGIKLKVDKGFLNELTEK